MPTRRSRLDQRSLQPRDYCPSPYRFGHDPDLEFRLPPDGDAISLAVAQVQHHLAHLLRAQPDPRRASRLSATFGFSKQYWSLCLSGQSWMGETVLAAAISTWLIDPSRRRTS